MGSIQALRSEALAARSRDDTELQVSTYLGGVNKSLGSQTLNMLDQLQNVVIERTKAYNKANAGLKQKIEKKGGLGDTLVQFGFKLVDTFIGNLASIKNIALLAGKITNKTSAGNALGFAAFMAQNATYLIGIAAEIVSVATSFLSNAAMQDSIKYNVKSAIYDYEKMISQLGMMDGNHIPPDRNGGTGSASAGASRVLDKRDALMPRYKPRDASFIPNGAGNPTNILGSTNGYIGSLRRV